MGLYRSFESRPARALSFIRVSIQIETEAHEGFAMPTRASAFDRF